MTLASWFSSLRHSRRYPIRTEACRNRSRASRRRATFEALEDRFLLSTVNFVSDAASVSASGGGASGLLPDSGSTSNESSQRGMLLFRLLQI